MSPDSILATLELALCLGDHVWENDVAKLIVDKSCRFRLLVKVPIESICLLNSVLYVEDGNEIGVLQSAHNRHR